MNVTTDDWFTWTKKLSTNRSTQKDVNITNWFTWNNRTNPNQVYLDVHYYTNCINCTERTTTNGFIWTNITMTNGFTWTKVNSTNNFINGFTKSGFTKMTDKITKLMWGNLHVSNWSLWSNLLFWSQWSESTTFKIDFQSLRLPFLTKCKAFK